MGAHPILNKVSHTHEMAIPDWSAIVMAFDIGQKHQLRFPLRLESGSVSGHIVFDIPRVGIGVASVGSEFIGGLHEDEEGERIRDYRLVLTDAITMERKEVPVRSVFAPQTDESGIVSQTDLAVAGNASVFVLPQREDGELQDVAALHEANTRLQNTVASLAEMQTSNQPRRLAPEKHARMVAILGACIAEIRRWEKDAGEGPQDIPVEITALGNDTEILDYRADFVRAFEASGFQALATEWQPGPTGFDPFRRHITVLEGEEGNVIRPRILEALRSADLPVREAAFPMFRHMYNYMTAATYDRPVAHLIIGQRS